MGTTGTVALTTLISIIGLVILSVLGYFSLAPFAILLGTFIAGLATKEVKYGALVGFITALSVILIFGIVLFVLFILGLIAFATLILFFPFLEWSGNMLELMITTLLLPALLSPLIGALGGLSGRLFFGIEKEPTPSTPQVLSGFEGLSRIPPPVKNALICLSCGTPNDPRARFCSKCGSRLM